MPISMPHFKALFYQTSSKIKSFLQKNAKFLSAGGFAPKPLKQPLHWEFLATRLVTTHPNFWGFVLKIFIIPPHQNFLDPPLQQTPNQPTMGVDKFEANNQSGGNFFKALTSTRVLLYQKLISGGDVNQNTDSDAAPI